MKIKLQTMDPPMRRLLGWDRKTEDVYETNAETLGDFFREIKDQEGRTFHDRFMDDRDVILANCYVFFNCVAFLKKEEFSQPLKDGDKVILMRGLAGAGAG